MASVEKYDDAQFDDLYAALLRDDDLDVSADCWRELFRCRPESGQTHGGYLLRDGRQIVGVMGTLFGERRLGEATRPFCSLHTWIVRPEHRGHSLSLLRPALKLRHHTLLDFSPTEPVRRLLARTGFQPLDAALRFLLPLPGRPSAATFLTDRAQLRTTLSDEQKRLHDDHRLPHLRHVLCRTPSGDCYVIYSRVTHWRLDYCHIHYASDWDVFAAHSGPVRRFVARSESVRLVACNDRQLPPHRLPLSCRTRCTNGQMFRSKVVRPAEIDTLYSDVALTNMTTMQSWKTIARQWAASAKRLRSRASTGSDIRERSLASAAR